MRQRIDVSKSWESVNDTSKVSTGPQHIGNSLVLHHVAHTFSNPFCAVRSVLYNDKMCHTETNRLMVNSSHAKTEQKKNSSLYLMAMRIFSAIHFNWNSMFELTWRSFVLFSVFFYIIFFLGFVLLVFISFFDHINIYSTHYFDMKVLK